MTVTKIGEIVKIGGCTQLMFKSSHCNSLEDRAPIDEIYSANLKMSCNDLTTWQNTRIVDQAMPTGQHALSPLAVKEEIDKYI